MKESERKIKCIDTFPLSKFRALNRENVAYIPREFHPMPKPVKSEKKPPKPLKRTPLKKKYKPTGEREIFLQIWDERVSSDGKHRSEISGKELIEDTEHNLWVNQFMHILPKSNYKIFRLRKDNIMMGTIYEHAIQTTNPSKTKTNPQWDNFWKKYEELKQEYQKDWNSKTNKSIIQQIKDAPTL